MKQPTRLLPPRRWARGAVAALAALGALAATVASAQNVGPAGGGRQVTIAKDSAAGRVVSKVYEGSFSYVRIERAEPGAGPNLHPVAIDATALRGRLAAIRLGKEALFNDDELAEIVPPLVTALGRATAEQDVSFAVAGKHGALGPLVPRSVTTGRVFRTADGLQVIFGLAQKPFEGQFQGTGYLIAFEPGKRAGPVDRAVTLALGDAPGASKRADWLALNNAPPVPAAPPAPPAPLMSTPGAPAPLMAVPPAPAAPAAATRPTDADGLYRDVSERLKALQKLKDNGLISAQEYEEKRKQILKDL